ncbi:MAG: hypothetical protein Ct9H300mP13_6050 [Gammaproteobacteria bacterium]|nr:MAG: hypothetical protein Ct9H300mP13_6050 [Gammaproteobacteria bacterium]
MNEWVANSLFNGRDETFQGKDRRITGLEVRGLRATRRFQRPPWCWHAVGLNRTRRCGFDIGGRAGIFAASRHSHNMGDGIRMALEIGPNLMATGRAVIQSAGIFLHHLMETGLSWIISETFLSLGHHGQHKGERFVDEGEDVRNHTYVKFGREIMGQPFRTAIQIFDQKTIPLLRMSTASNR